MNAVEPRHPDRHTRPAGGTPALPTGPEVRSSARLPRECARQTVGAQAGPIVDGGKLVPGRTPCADGYGVGGIWRRCDDAPSTFSRDTRRVRVTQAGARPARAHGCGRASRNHSPARGRSLRRVRETQRRLHTGCVPGEKRERPVRGCREMERSLNMIMTRGMKRACARSSVARGVPHPMITRESDASRSGQSRRAGVRGRKDMKEKYMMTSIPGMIGIHSDASVPDLQSRSALVKTP
jgi:hypothetical protein